MKQSKLAKLNKKRRRRILNDRLNSIAAALGSRVYSSDLYKDFAAKGVRPEHLTAEISAILRKEVTLGE